MNVMDGKEVSGFCNEMLKAKMEGKITQEQLDYEMSKLSLEFIDEYRYKSSPSLEYGSHLFMNLSEEKKKKLDDKERAVHELEIRKWKDECSKIHAVNDSNLCWLKYILNILKQKDHPGFYKVIEVMGTHKI